MKRDTDVSSKIKSLDELMVLVRQLKKKGKTVVYCHGVFDLLHPGHIRHLAIAKGQGDVLVVTITRDDLVNKGPGRPVFNHRLRAESIAALGCVDFVAVNNSPTAVQTIKRLRPHLYVKGREYAKREDDITGKIYDEERAIKSVGGDIYFTEDITFSSTSLLNVHFKMFPEGVSDFLRRFKKRHDAEGIIKKLKNLRRLKVLIIGDTIIDEYRYCSGIGKPQKDNIIATKYLYDERFAGGTLAVANHVAGFCKQVHLVSLLGGRNDYNRFIKSKLRPNVKARFFTKKDIATVVKRRFLDPSFLTKMFELCFMDDFTLDAKLQRKILGYLNATIRQYDVVIVSDFGHGFINDEIVKVLCKKARFLAVNTQANSANMGYNLITKYPKAHHICIDEPEIRLALHDKFSDLKSLVPRLAKTINCKRVSITRGHRGSLVYSKKEGMFIAPVFSKEIVDRMGAGDACLAVTSLASAVGFSAEETAFVCNAVGALAVLIVGNRNAIDPVTLYKFIVTLLR